MEELVLAGVSLKQACLSSWSTKSKQQMATFLMSIWICTSSTVPLRAYFLRSLPQGRTCTLTLQRFLLRHGNLLDPCPVINPHSVLLQKGHCAQSQTRADCPQTNHVWQSEPRQNRRINRKMRAGAADKMMCTGTPLKPSMRSGLMCVDTVT